MTAVLFEAVFAGLGVLAAAFGCVGAVLAREPLAKLHFLAPVTTLGVPLFSIAAVIYFGISLGSATIILIALVVAFGGPAVTIAVGRSLADERGLDVGRSPE
ncbi:monovalent cation/H(+) antiporter subunit G [Arthrobacter bambusae]|uniref:monovalent cation/H(+) antiporter subunit G n=1 Tax=Arthrobacter bambusae TaxID=1338426 RepID=UPI0027834195|nr:monovalent cation/H(+) antiporter subunit G [Arthrobacter bambusae]MDQ0028426.1 multisubunit Na+/H+ antiporter MnhG subunit [Arthrobacter bambusae]MDQ0096779.1 multisubunit Na+/H+ antiporter MnhG subunit [Arthrobacter bambusae]